MYAVARWTTAYTGLRRLELSAGNAPRRAYAVRPESAIAVRADGHLISRLRFPLLHVDLYTDRYQY